MSFCIKCGDIVYSSSYKTWNNLRRVLIKSTFDYINFKFKNDSNNTNVNNKDCTYILYKKKIHNLIDCIQLGEKQKLFGISIDITIHKFNEMVTNISYVNALIFFDIVGLYFLCNKNDFEGLYSPGNAIDICNLFDLIEPFIKNNSEEVYTIIYINGGEEFGNKLYDLFKLAGLKNKKIYIS
jgi:hypothetical protein